MYRPRRSNLNREIPYFLLSYRDAYMDAMYPAENKQAEYGSIYPMEADLLRAKLTQRQVTALKELLRQYSGDRN